MDKYIVGDFLNPKPETDIAVDGLQPALDKMCELAAETEGYVVGVWEEGNDYAAYIAIDGEMFRADG